MQKNFLFMLVSFFSLFAFSNGYAQEDVSSFQQIEEASYEKIYITPDRILLYPEGIFFLNDLGELMPVRCVASDRSELYVVAAFYRCLVCGTYNRDGVCIKTTCSLYGREVE